MVWCFGSVALLLVLLGLMALTSHPLRLIAKLKPILLLRGCLALSCLALALGFIALALLLGR